jgi:hypothetical protein
VAEGFAVVAKSEFEDREAGVHENRVRRPGKPDNPPAVVPGAVRRQARFPGPVTAQLGPAFTAALTVIPGLARLPAWAVATVIRWPADRECGAAGAASSGRPPRR